MNKYLSYEKSKRLSELGYQAPEGTYVWVELYPAITYEVLDGKKEIDYPKTEHYYAGDDKHDFHLQQQWNDKRKFVTDYKSDICGELVGYYAAPDCHDLLMELQKYCEDYGRIAFQISYDGFEIEICDPNPVEALGDAYIKILEEKRKEEG